MPFDPLIAESRFGLGLSPRIAPPGSVAAMLAALAGPDLAAQEWPIPTLAQAQPLVSARRAANRDSRSDDAATRAQAEALLAEYRDRAIAAELAHFGQMMARSVTTADGLRERLVAFWADHFTVTSRSGFTIHLVGPYVEEAIRPHVAGRFADMLRAAVLHPMMLDYLDQSTSMGPNSVAARRRDRGLNENLAREVLELHTVGIDGPYDQMDVRELAELLTGVTWDEDQDQTVFREDWAEPGSETVLDQTFPRESSLATINRALDALAIHPATARHLAAKLVRAFVSDDPDPDLVAALETTFIQTGGDLLAVTQSLLDHPAAWQPTPAKVRSPMEFLVAALRALDVGPDGVRLTDLQDARRLYLNPLNSMGQPWEKAPGPDGWPDDSRAWVTPQFMAARIEWSIQMPKRILAELPDPRDFVLRAMGPSPPEDVQFAAAAAEDRALGIGVVLASAAFQRR